MGTGIILLGVEDMHDTVYPYVPVQAPWIGAHFVWLACFSLVLLIAGAALHSTQRRSRVKHALLALGATSAVFLACYMHWESKHFEGLSKCKVNLNLFQTELEAYRVDNHGELPPSLSYLTPTYLKTLPKCPEAGTDTYSQSYEFVNAPPIYTIGCTGLHHAAIGVGWVNFPQFSSRDWRPVNGPRELMVKP